MLIKVRVFPESSEDRVVSLKEDTYEVYVRAAAQNGHANREVSYLLGKHFGARVKMVAGGTSTHKVFEVSET